PAVFSPRMVAASAAIRGDWRAAMDPFERVQSPAHARDLMTSVRRRVIGCLTCAALAGLVYPYGELAWKCRVGQFDSEAYVWARAYSRFYVGSNPPLSRRSPLSSRYSSSRSLTGSDKLLGTSSPCWILKRTFDS